MYTVQLYTCTLLTKFAQNANFCQKFDKCSRLNNRHEQKVTCVFRLVNWLRRDHVTLQKLRLPDQKRWENWPFWRKTAKLRWTRSQRASCRRIEQNGKSPATRPARSNARTCNSTRRSSHYGFSAEIRKKVSNSLNRHNPPYHAFYRYI